MLKFFRSVAKPLGFVFLMLCVNMFIPAAVPGVNGVTMTFLVDCSMSIFCGIYLYHRDLLRDHTRPCFTKAGLKTLYILSVPIWYLGQTGSSYLLGRFGSGALDSYNQVAMSNEWLFLLLTVTAAPIFEELMFRGVVFNCFLDGFSPTVSLIASSLLFGALHFTLPHLWFTSLMGLIFGIVYYYTGQLRYSMICHSFTNLLGFVAVGWPIPGLLLQPVVFVSLTAMAFLVPAKLFLSVDKKETPAAD